MNYKIITELGNRKVNEDYAAAEKCGNMNCFVLCDGLGGHGMGDVASEYAAYSFMEHFRECPALDSENIAEAFEFAQKKILETQKKLNARDSMKTTAVVLLIDDRTAKWAHIGDSRLYLFYKNKIVLRTIDHSVPQMLAIAGDINESQIRKHPDRNRLLRVMGTDWSSRKYEISDGRPVSKCQAFLLCSDGFWEYITEDTMCSYLKKSKSAEEWMSMMLAEVKKNGMSENMDNHTAIAIIL